MASVTLSPDELRPLVRPIVKEVVRELDDRRRAAQGKLAFTEAEAAEMLSLNSWQLRDLRLEGKITYTRVVGRRIRYTLKDLEDYLDRGRQVE